MRKMTGNHEKRKTKHAWSAFVDFMNERFSLDVKELAY